MCITSQQFPAKVPQHRLCWCRTIDNKARPPDIKVRGNETSCHKEEPCSRQGALETVSPAEYAAPAAKYTLKENLLLIYLPHKIFGD